MFCEPACSPSPTPSVLPPLSTGGQAMRDTLQYGAAAPAGFLNAGAGGLTSSRAGSAPYSAAATLEQQQAYYYSQQQQSDGSCGDGPSSARGDRSNGTATAAAGAVISGSGGERCSRFSSASGMRPSFSGGALSASAGAKAGAGGNGGGAAMGVTLQARDAEAAAAGLGLGAGAVAAGAGRRTLAVEFGHSNHSGDGDVTGADVDASFDLSALVPDSATIEAMQEHYEELEAAVGGGLGAGAAGESRFGAGAGAGAVGAAGLASVDAARGWSDDAIDRLLSKEATGAYEDLGVLARGKFRYALMVNTRTTRVFIFSHIALAYGDPLFCFSFSFFL
jgi:hypothetical protein